MNVLSRRDFLARATGTVATAAAAAGGLGSLLSACGSGNLGAAVADQPLPPAPNHPVTWPITAGNKPIADGLLAETDATLHVYAWADRIAAECLHQFSRRYRCLVEVTTFGSIHEAIATMTTKPTRFDVFIGAPVAMLGRLISNGLIQPLNHSYIPNIGQVWLPFSNPFYDQHWQYTVPYTVYATGIGWRRDQVDGDPYALANGWDLLRQPKYSGHTALLDDYREGISLGLLSDDEIDLNTADPLLIDNAGRSMTELVNLVRPKLDNTFGGLVSGTTSLQQAWSGQVAAAGKNLPPGTPNDVLGFWFPPNGAGPVANDTMTIPRSARSPVLAHLLLNFMLNTPNAVTNTRATGYMQPMNWMTPQRLVHDGLLPASLISTAVLAIDYYRGLKELELQSAADALWQQAWQSVVTHMHLSAVL